MVGVGRYKRAALPLHLPSWKTILAGILRDAVPFAVRDNKLSGRLGELMLKAIHLTLQIRLGLLQPLDLLFKLLEVLVSSLPECSVAWRSVMLLPADRPRPTDFWALRNCSRRFATRSLACVSTMHRGRKK